MRKRKVSAGLLRGVGPHTIVVSTCLALASVEPAAAQTVIMKNGPGEGRELKFAAQSLAPAQQQAAADPATPAGEPKVSSEKPTSPNATASLVNALVEKGVLTEEQANEIIKQADDETYVGREAAKDATDKAAEAAKAAREAALAASPPGTKHVAYVPEVVKRQLRDEIRAEVMAKAQQENWASPGKYPEWASRMHFYGDVRTRYEGIFYPDGNLPAGYFPNFNAINTGSPYDITTGRDNPYPRFNTDQDRNRFRLRARLGLEAELSEDFEAGLRLATGDSSSPVSPNQSFGASGGDFSKYAVWLDRAFIRYQPIDEVTINTGRFDNPFFDPTDLVWDPDLGFDGAVIQGKYAIRPDLIPFLVAGAFPIFNTDLNFATNRDNKFPSDDKYLFGAQVGVGLKPVPDIGIKIGAAYYDFTNVQGKASSPCEVVNASSACDTDALRPSFAQKGNTYMPLRNIMPTVANSGGTTTQYQYFGLASDFRDLVITAQVDIAHLHPYHVIFDGAYLQNLAFDRAEIAAVAINNYGAGELSTGGPFEGGSVGWFARATVGNSKLTEFGDWNAHIGYKYLESDATIDAFTDSDFGLGGTNLKGYFLGGNLALSKNVSTSVKGYSATSVAGPTYAVDILQLDLNAKF